MLRSDLCDFSDVYIAVKGYIIVTNANNAKRNKVVAFKKNAPFIHCISKINDIKIELFKYKTSITGNTYNVGDGEAGYDAAKVGKNETEVVIPLKHLRKFWRTLNIPLIVNQN